jgi:ribonuclease BN (tRNA processing enzyme)
MPGPSGGQTRQRSLLPGLDGHGHMTPELAATTASRSGARHLVLTHLARPGDAPAAAAAGARYVGADPVTLVTAAVPGTTISLRSR